MRMFHYQAFGGHLASDFAMPDFEPSLSARADWLVREESAPVATPGRLLGTFDTSLGDQLRLSETPHGVRFESDTVGVWEIEQNSRISYAPPPSAPSELLRSMLLGPVFYLILERTGTLCLHGSAVAWDDCGIAFVAPKLHGKSTLALALATAGARLVSDDLVVVNSDSTPQMRPGTRGLRLFRDSIAMLGARRWSRSGHNAAKSTLRPPSDAVGPSVWPLTTVYVLDPILTNDVERIALRGATAAVALAQRMKLPDTLIGPDAVASRLRRIVRLASNVAVYRLRFAHRWEAIIDVVRALHSWHSIPLSEPDWARTPLIRPSAVKLAQPST
jgi:hypothetical protein